MSLSRCVQPEILDHLAADDPHAVRSRADLRRINRIMGARTIMLRALQTMAPPRHVIELGAGDGTLMLALAKRLGDRWPQVHLTLLDRKNMAAPGTIGAFHALGWQLDISDIDVLDWATRPMPARYDLVIANLFLHHFSDAQLAMLLPAIAGRADALFVCEPRRGRLPLAASRLIGLIGANAVTQNDAVLSVRAGFAGKELTGLWPREYPDWQLNEYAAGLFSHCFFAARKDG